MLGRILNPLSKVPPLVIRGASGTARLGWQAAKRGAGAAKTATALGLVLSLLLAAYSAYVGYEGAKDNIEARVVAPGKRAADAAEAGYEEAAARAGRFATKCAENPEYSVPSLAGVALSLFSVVHYRRRGHTLAAAALATLTKLPPDGALPRAFTPAERGLDHADREIRFTALSRLQGELEAKIKGRELGVDALRAEAAARRTGVKNAQAALTAALEAAARADAAFAARAAEDEADKKKLTEVDAALERMVDAA